MRLIAYIGVFIGVLLTVLNLTLTHSLASDGNTLANVDEQMERNLQAVEVLQEEIARAQSLTDIKRKAVLLGISVPIHQTTVVNSKTYLSQTPVQHHRAQ